MIQIKKIYKDWLHEPIARDYQPIITLNGQALWLRKQSVKNQWLIEAEHPKSPPMITRYDNLIESLNYSKKTDIKKDARQDLEQDLVDLVFNKLDFDAVRLYSLEADCSGTVIAERVRPEVASYLNYHFLATDVPQKVRDNYHQILYRYIPSIESGEDVVRTKSNDINNFLLLADSRCVVPIHKGYLQNMGVEAAFSVPIIIDNNLWGFLACQHRTAKYIHPQDRFFCRLLMEYFSLSLDLYIQKQRALRQNSLLSLQANIEEIIEQYEQVKDVFADDRLSLNKKMDACGYVVKIENDYTKVGITLSKNEINSLIKWVNLQIKGHVFYCNDLQAIFPASKQFSQLIYGLLAIKLSATTDGFILFFKKEHIDIITWAGDPKTIMTDLNKDDPNSPKRSFSAWVEQVKGRSKAWSDTEVQFAHVLKEIIADKWLQQTLTTESTIDPLTKAYNRHYLNETIKKINAEKRQQASPICVAMIDIDDFKLVNDTYGHVVGDKVLAGVSKILSSHIRESDKIYRYGGEEFVIILNSCPIDTAYKIMNDSLVSIRQHEYQLSKKIKFNVTASIGITVDNKNKKKIVSLINEADDAMYQAKKKGKNQVIVFK